MVSTCKVNTKLLYCFTLYFLHFTTNGCMAQEKESDKSLYDNLPIIYNFDEECQQPQNNVNVNNKNLNLCPSIVWWLKDKLRLRLHVHSLENYEIESCFEICLNLPTCIGVLRNGKTCGTYDRTHQSHYQGGFKAYILTCCELKVDRKLGLNLQSIPTIFSSSSFEICLSSTQVNNYNNYPNNMPNMMNQMPNNVGGGMMAMMESRVFIYYEKRIFIGYKSFRNKNILECMNECLRDMRCKSFAMYVQYNFITECHFSSDTTQSAWYAETYGYVYQLSTCRFNSQQVSKSNNLVMLFQTNKFCPSFSTRNARNCGNKVWQVKDNVRLKGHYRVYTMDLLEKCLMDCLQNVECYSVSIDWTYVRCLFFHEDKNNSTYYGQVAWTTYFLTCCDANRAPGGGASSNFTNPSITGPAGIVIQSGKIRSDATSIYKNFPIIVYNFLLVIYLIVAILTC